MVQSDPTPSTSLPDEAPEATVVGVADTDHPDTVDTAQAPSTAQANFDLEMMRNRLSAQLGELKDPYDEKLPEPKASPKYWVSVAFGLAALFLVAYLFANIMREAIESQPVVAGLEEDVLQGEEEEEVAPQPTIEITYVAPNQP